MWIRSRSLLTFSSLFHRMKLDHAVEEVTLWNPHYFDSLLLSPPWLSLDWSHASKTRCGGLPSVCLRLSRNMLQWQRRAERRQEPRSRGALGRGRGQLVETEAEGEVARIAEMSLPTNCAYLAPSVQDRCFKVRSGNICGSPCAVNRPIDIVQKRRR